MRIMLALIWAGVAMADDAPPVVKITPLGSHAGEFCRNDRALLFEDPTGVRVLYDPGRTIAGGADPRLGDVHVVILSHAHTDHVGDVKPDPNSPGTCGNPGTVTAGPNTNLADIVAAKNSAFLAGGEMADYFARKVQDITGSPTAGCAAAGLTNEFVVPLSSPCTATLRPGGSRTARMNGAAVGVKIVTVQAFHSNGIAAAFVDAQGVAPGTTGYGGSEGGFVIKFTNGLTAYLTGDTGMFGDMKTIIRKYYQPNLMVANISDTATLGPDEGAFVAQQLVKPRTVIPSHINEAATSGGAAAGQRMQRFIQDLAGTDIAVVLPLSERVLQLDGSGNCLNCQ